VSQDRKDKLVEARNTGTPIWDVVNGDTGGGSYGAPSFTARITNRNVTAAASGQSVPVSYEIENYGTAEGTASVTFQGRGDIFHQGDVPLAAGETKTITEETYVGEDAERGTHGMRLYLNSEEVDKGHFTITDPPPGVGDDDDSSGGSGGSGGGDSSGGSGGSIGNRLAQIDQKKLAAAGGAAALGYLLLR